MSLLMEALRKAEAAKRAGLQANDSVSAAPAPELPVEDEEEYKDEYSPVPEVFKYTTTDELLALSQREEPEPVKQQSYSPPSEKSLPVTDDVLDDYLSDPADIEHEELPPSRPERER